MRKSGEVVAWERARLKTKAKEELRGCFGRVYLLCIAACLLGCGGNGGYFGGGPTITRVRDEAQEGAAALRLAVGSAAGWLPGIGMWLPYAGIGLLLFYIFVSMPMNVGFSRYFITPPYGGKGWGELLFSFGGGRYGGILQAKLVTSLCLFGWTLLFVFPGIVKSYEYSMVPYLLAENPELSPGQAMARSRELTMGRKWDLFVLDLSFLGWDLLALLALSFFAGLVYPRMAEFDTWLAMLAAASLVRPVVCAYREAVWGQAYLEIKTDS